MWLSGEGESWRGYLKGEVSAIIVKTPYYAECERRSHITKATWLCTVCPVKEDMSLF